MDIVSAYTPTPYYAEAALLFRTAVEALGVTPRIIEYPDRGSWIENCRAKPLLIAALRRPGHSLLWIDIDAVVRELPEEPEGVDFAAVPRRPRDDRDWQGGLLYFADTLAATLLLREYVAGVASQPHWSDEAALNWCRFTRATIAPLRAPGIRAGLSGNASKYNRGENP